MIILETKISQHNKDLIQKHVSGLFRDATLEFYGIKTARIKELINVELPDVKVKGSSSDFIFLLEDNTYLHFEFESKYNKEDLIPRDELAINSVKLAQAMPNKRKRDICIAAAFAFANKYLDVNGLEKIKEALVMMELATMFVEEGRQEGRLEGKMEAARDMLRENVPIENIARYLRLDESTIIQLKTKLDSEDE